MYLATGLYLQPSKHKVHLDIKIVYRLVFGLGMA